MCVCAHARARAFVCVCVRHPDSVVVVVPVQVMEKLDKVETGLRTVATSSSGGFQHRRHRGGGRARRRLIVQLVHRGGGPHAGRGARRADQPQVSDTRLVCSVSWSPGALVLRAAGRPVSIRQSWNEIPDSSCPCCLPSVCGYYSSVLCSSV